MLKPETSDEDSPLACLSDLWYTASKLIEHQGEIDTFRSPGPGVLNSWPPATYQIVFSAQALHHLDSEVQQKLYRSLFKLLSPGGVFLLNERIALKPGAFSDLYRSAWNRLERVSAYTCISIGP